MPRSITVRADAYIRTHVDEDEAYDLLHEIEEEKKKLGIKEFPLAHDWYGLDDIEAVVKHLASRNIGDDDYDLRDYTLYPDFS